MEDYKRYLEQAVISDKAHINIYKSLSIMLFLIWIITKLFLAKDIMNELQILGGGMVLFMSIPVLLVFLFTSKTYQKNILSVIIIVVGFVVINYFHNYLSILQNKFSPMGVLIISVQPFLLIFPPFVWLANTRFKDPELFGTQRDKKLIMNIKSIYVFFFISSLALGVGGYMFFTDFIEGIVKGGSAKATAEIYNFLLFGFIIGCVITIFYWRKNVKTENLYYILNSAIPVTQYPKKIIRYGLTLIVCLLIISYSAEKWRGDWLFWFECSALISLMTIHLWRFYKPIFLGIDEKIIPSKFNLPDLTSPKTLATAILLYVVIIFWLFIIGQTLKEFGIIKL